MIDDYINEVDDVVESYASAKQIEELNRTIIELRKRIVYLESEIQRYEKIPVPRLVIEQIVDLEQKIKGKDADLEYYKKHVPVQVIINRENKKKPTRRGGVPR